MYNDCPVLSSVINISNIYISQQSQVDWFFIGLLTLFFFFNIILNTNRFIYKAFVHNNINVYKGVVQIVLLTIFLCKNNNPDHNANTITISEAVKWFGFHFSFFIPFYNHFLSRSQLKKWWVNNEESENKLTTKIRL